MNARRMIQRQRHWMFILAVASMAAFSANAQKCSQGCAIGEPSTLKVGPCEAVIKGPVSAPITCSSPMNLALSTTNVWERTGEESPSSVSVILAGTCDHGVEMSKPDVVDVEYTDALTAGELKCDVKSLHMKLSLGYTSGGLMAGRLALDSAAPSNAIYSSSSLVLTNPRVEDVVHMDSGRQILAPEAFVVITNTSAQSYDVSFYPPRRVEIRETVTPGLSYFVNGILVQHFTTNLCYVIQPGTLPFAQYSVENPDGSNACSRLRITRNPGGSTEAVSEFAWVDGQWSLSEGGGLRTTWMATSQNGGLLAKTWRVADGADTAASTVRKTYKTIDEAERVVEEVQDPDGEALTTSYDYYESGPSTGWLKKQTRSDGSWTSHAYQSDNRESETRAGWLDGGSEDACRVTTRSYAPFLTTNDIPVGVPRDDGTTDPTTPRVETVAIAGVPVSKTLRTVALDTMGYRRIEEVRLLDPAETNLVAAWADPANPRTLSRYMPESDFKPCSKQPELIVRPDGTATHYAYIDGYCTTGGGSSASSGLPGAFEIVSGGPHFTTTITHGTRESFGLAPDGLATNGFNGVPGRTTREVVVATKIGKLELQRETYVCTGQDTYERISWTTTTRDELGRVVATRSSDGTRTEKSWNGDLLAYEIGADGVRTDYTYDALGRHILVSRSSQVNPVNPVILSETRYAYDAESRVLSTIRYPLPVGEGQGEGLSPQTVTNAYDGAGRLVWTRSPDGTETAYDYGTTAAGLPYTATIRGYGTALASTNTVVRHKDGQAAYTEFNGTRKTTYAYGVNADGSRWTKTFEGPLAGNSPVWTCSTSDALGRTIREERPGYDGAILVTENTYNAAGQLLATTQTSQANPVNPVILSKNLYAYDALGEAVVTARDLDLDGQIDFSGPDVVSSNATAYVQLGSAWWRESRQYAFPDTGSAAALLVSTSRQRLSGLGGAYSADGASGVLAAESVSIDVRGNPSTSRTVVDRDAATVYQIAQAPDSTIAALSVTVNGLRQSSRTTHNLTTTYDYDALGRMVSMQDARGGVYSRGYDEQGRVVWESDPATNGTWYAYDALGRQVAVTNALGHVVETAYDAEDRVIATWGATYPVEYDYDAYGRMTAMRTFRDEEGAGDETRWLYEDATGVLTNKVYADGKGTAYSYTPDGQLASRTWARGVTTTYTYTNVSSLAAIDYSDDTPDVFFQYDRLGRMTSAIVAGVSTNAYTYDPETLALSVETQNGMEINRTTDSLGRSTGLSVAGVGDPGSPYAVTYGYDAYGRFQSVESAQSADTFTYTYLSGSSLVSGMTASTGHAWSRSYEPHRNLISAVQNTFGPAIISRFDYVNDAIGRRTAISRSGTAFDTPVQDAYGYNARSEVTSARRTLASDPNQEVRGFSYDYAYDPIGNRTSSTEYDHEDNALVESYTANALNQYTQRTVPGYAGVHGCATNTATVTVNGNTAWRLGEYFYGGDDVANAASAVMKELDITAVVNPPGTNDADLVQSVTGRVFVAQSAEAFTHDDDGNMLSDGRFIYTWDGENRLIAVETRADLPASVPRVKVSYAYDHQSRRIGKQPYALDGATWQPAAPQHYTYDGWNMIAETSGTNTTHYVWGLDLSGSRQGAGGVGGLLAIVQNGETYHSAFDGNGNVTEYVSTDGAIAAHYEYSPFGETVIQAGPLADAFAFRFSTKYLENEAKLYYYGYRFYATNIGRWINRDPIGERGGRNLSSFCLNNSLLNIDSRGKAAMNWGGVGGNFGPGPLLPPPSPPLPPEDEIIDILGIDFSTNIDGMFDFSNDPDELILALNDLLPECYKKLKDAEAKARAWHDTIRQEYQCCNRDGTPFDLRDYPGAVKEYASSVPYGDRHTYGVLHCALGYYAGENGVDNPCLAVANILHELKEFATFGEWLPQSVVSHGKNPIGWYGDTLVDVIFVFAGSTFSSVDKCIPSECTKKEGK